MIALGLSVLGGGCERELSPIAAGAVAGHDPEAAASTPRLPASPPLAYPAIRCSECHNKMFDEWSSSAHSRARRSPLYQRTRELAGAAGKGCDDCHAPLAARLAAGDPATADGVTCEVCHNIKEVEPRRAGAGFALHLEDHTKYGPICDAEDHYFHKMGCSPLHEQAQFCAACHLYHRPLPGGGELPVFTEFEEWQGGPHAAGGVQCQACHMPGERAEVAEGAGERSGVSHHGLLGFRGDLRGRALEATATVSVVSADRIALDVKVENVGAGHMVPSGLPGRRVVLRAVAISDAGEEVGRAEHQFGRVLVDEDGEVAPFYEAVRVASDDRIPPREARRVRLELDAPARGEIRIELVWRALDARLAARLDVDLPEDLLLSRATLTLAETPAQRRPGLPRTLELER